MTAKWVSNIVNVLRECDIPQVQTALIREFYNKDGELVIGKCAMGVLSCEAGMTLSVDMNEDLINDTANYQQILKLYDVPEEWWGNELLPECLSIGSPHFDDRFFDEDEDVYFHTVQLHQFIFRMNDNGFTFKDIADCIEVTFEDVEDE